MASEFDEREEELRRIRSERRLDLLAQSVAASLADPEAVGEILPDDELREFLDPPSGEVVPDLDEQRRLKMIDDVFTYIRTLRDTSRTRNAYHSAALRAQILRIIDRELQASLRLFDRESIACPEPRRSEAMSGSMGGSPLSHFGRTRST